MAPSVLHLSPISRRRVLSLAAAAAVPALAAPMRQLAAQGTPLASPVAAPPAAATPLAGTPVAAASPMPSTLAADASPEFLAVADVLVEAMRVHQVPGAALGILAGEREEHAAFGVESIASLAPVTPQTLFGIGSVTKTFTATAIWRLIDQGALARDARIRTYLPDFRLRDEAVAANVTVEHLLTHTAGWYGDDFTDTGSDDAALARYVTETLPEQPQLFPPGAHFSYNNAGFDLLGRLVEVVTGTTYNAAMANLLLGPLGLSDTLLAHDAVLARPYADGHYAATLDGESSLAILAPLRLPRAMDPAGGIWSTTRDMLRYARFHFGAGTRGGPARVVQPESLTQMQTPAIALPGVSMAMGRSWFVQDIAGLRVIAHAGETGGHITRFVAIPEREFAIIVLTNNGDGGADAALDALEAAWANYPGLAALSGQFGYEAQFSVPPETPTLTLTPEQLAAYVGRYADPDQTLIVTAKDGALELTYEPSPPPPISLVSEVPPTPPTALTFIAEDVAAWDGSRLPFVRDADGTVQGVAVSLWFVPRVSEDPGG